MPRPAPSPSFAGALYALALPLLASGQESTGLGAVSHEERDVVAAAAGVEESLLSRPNGRGLEGKGHRQGLAGEALPPCSEDEDCDDGQPCTEDSCEPTSAACVYEPRPAGEPCDDLSSCTAGETCDGEGACVGTPPDCSDGIACTTDECEETTSECIHLAMGCGECNETRVAPVDQAPFDRFGWSVAVDFVHALVGAPDDDVSGADSGSATLFRDEGGTWVESARLMPGDGSAGDAFGRSVAVSGDVALVGAPFDGDAGAESGSAYVFRYDGSDWQQEAKLVASDAEVGDRFGESVALSQGVAVVGAYEEDDGGLDAGAAYVFRLEGAVWAEERKLVAVDSAAGAQFGRSVSVWGDALLVGAPGDAEGGEEAGAAHLFRHDGTAWGFEAKLRADDAAANDEFGRSVSLSQDVALIGAYREGGFGAAYVFRGAGGPWLQEAKLGTRHASAGAWFGFSVSVWDDVALVGAYADTGLAPFSGAAYRFRHDGVNWIEEEKLVASDGALVDFFGWSVAVSDRFSVVGAYQDDEGGDTAGSAYLYAHAPAAPPEVSPPGLDENSGAFVVAKEGTQLRFAWQALPEDVGLYVGSLAGLRGPTGYDHAASSACRLSGTNVLLADPLPALAYVLVAAAGCGSGSADGPTGRDSSGAARPSAAELGLPACP